MPGRQFAGVQASWPHLAGSPLEGGRKVRIRLPPEESLQTIGSSPAGAMRAPSNRAPQKRNDTIHRCPRTGSSNPPPSATSPATATARSDRRRRARPGNGLPTKHRVSKPIPIKNRVRRRLFAGDDVGQENSIELAAFREPRQILPISDRVVLGRAVARMVHMPCWIWPTQFMSNALRRISFVIGGVPRPCGCGVYQK